MEPRKLIEAMAVAERLKNNTRHSYTTAGRKESVAEHSWRLILLAYFVSDEFKDIDLEKLMKMCLIHDLGEAFTGDIPSFLKNNDDEEREQRQGDEGEKHIVGFHQLDRRVLFLFAGFTIDGAHACVSSLPQNSELPLSLPVTLLTSTSITMLNSDWNRPMAAE